VSYVLFKVHRQTKIKLYKALIRSIVWYGIEAFQRKLLRKICGTVLVNGQWRNKYTRKSEICKLYKETGANQQYEIEKTPMGGSCDEGEEGKGAQESSAMINTREKTSWKAQRERLDTVDRDAQRGC
jgi:hypothetical protein